MRELRIVSRLRNEMIDLTQEIQKGVKEEKIKNGYVIVYVPHTTAAVTINEGADSSVQHDIIETLKRLVPQNGKYNHIEGNSDAHIKASLLNSSIIVLIKTGRLLLGTWQHIFFYEGDGPRQRKVYVEYVSQTKFS